MRSPYQSSYIAVAQVQTPQQISIPPEVITGGGGAIAGILVSGLIKNYLDNINKRSQIDNESAQSTSQTLIKQQANLVDDMRKERDDMYKERDDARKERERMIIAVEHITEVMSEVANTLKRVEAILVKFSS